jgi:hypothetical protein
LKHPQAAAKGSIALGRGSSAESSGQKRNG